MSARSAAQAKRRDAEPKRLRLVRRRSRKLIRRSPGRRFAPVALVGATLMFTAIIAVLLTQVVLAQSAFTLEELQRRVERAREKQETLALEVARLSSPGRVERYARENLGMVDPTEVRYIVARIGQPRSVRSARSAARPILGSSTAAGVGLEEEAP